MDLSRIWVPVLAVLFFVIGLSADVLGGQVIQASEVRSKILAGEPAIFVNCVIVGDINLRELKIDRPVHFSNTVFQNSVDFDSTTFNNDADFSGSQFNDNANFAKSQFNGYASFAESKFISSADEDWTRIGELARLTGPEFNLDANFAESQFNGYADFSGSQFKGHAYFTRSQFKDNTYFRHTTFNDDTDFSNSQFSDDADFRSAVFEKAVSFEDVRFFNPLSSFACDWGLISIHFGFDEANRLYYHYRVYRMEELWAAGQYLELPFDVLAWIFCGFGVIPSLCLAWIISLILCFAAIFRFGSGVEKAPDSEKQRNALWKPTTNKKYLQAISFSDALYFSILVFFVTPPPSYLQPRGRWKYIVLAEDILGWLLITLFTVTVGNVMIR
jgi:hypothetical protein